jgi:hypothetical protein
MATDEGIIEIPILSREISCIALSALSFVFVSILPLQGNDESNVSVVHTASLVRLLLTVHISDLPAEQTVPWRTSA